MNYWRWSPRPPGLTVPAEHVMWPLGCCLRVEPLTTRLQDKLSYQENVRTPKCHTVYIPLTQYRVDVGPSSQTTAQHPPGIGLSPAGAGVWGNIYVPCGGVTGWTPTKQETSNQRWFNAGTGRRRWTNIKPALVQRTVCVGQMGLYIRHPGIAEPPGGRYAVVLTGPGVRQGGGVHSHPVPLYPRGGGGIMRVHTPYVLIYPANFLHP